MDFAGQYKGFFAEFCPESFAALRIFRGGGANGLGMRGLSLWVGLTTVMRTQQTGHSES
jgi:hypothetical protein